MKASLKATRGYGLLEGFLARKRAKMADKLISSEFRKGRILDIGCGTYPFFLFNTSFSEKYGLDKAVQESDFDTFQKDRIHLKQYDIEQEGILPFDDGYFDVVTMLAVFEHIEPKRVVSLLKEIQRVLKPGGMFIMTTPTSWTDGLLRLMAKFRLVSPVEIEEHKDIYTPQKIASILESAGFKREHTSTGYFELFMNIWAISNNYQ
jgi:SAM-dependent methyltransferase